jgi:hypothetical protein
VQSGGNTLVITDKVRCNSVTIPQPVTKILQINSPGPMGPPGPSGSGGSGGGSNATASFTTSSIWTFNHNLGSLFVVIQTFNNSYNEIYPQNVQLVNTSSATITFASPQSGWAIASLGGGNNSITSSYALTASYAQTASYVLNVVSASYASTASYVVTAQTSSYVLNAVSASYASTASYVVTAQTSSYVLNAVSSSYAATSSYANNFTVAGTLIAQTIVVQTITSSVDYVTGSTRFGSLLSNTHQFTGSVSISGSLALNGNSVVTSNQTSSFVTNSQTSSMTVATASYALNATSASYAATASIVQLPILDEGNQIAPYPTKLNFAGDGVYTSKINNDITVFIPGALGGISSVLSANQPLTGSKNINVAATSSFFIRTDNYPSGTFFISSSLVRLGDWSGSVNNNFIEINDDSNYIRLRSSNVSLTGSLNITGSGITSTGSINITQGTFNVDGVNVLDTALAYAIALG